MSTVVYKRKIRRGSLSKRPVCDVGLGGRDFVTGILEVVGSDVIRGLPVEDLAENLANPLLVSLARRRVPAVKTVELRRYEFRFTNGMSGSREPNYLDTADISLSTFKDRMVLHSHFLKSLSA